MIIELDTETGFVIYKFTSEEDIDLFFSEEKE